MKQLTDTIPAVLANAASQYGDALAIDDVSGNWSYSQLHLAAVGVSKALLANGIHQVIALLSGHQIYHNGLLPV